MFRNALIVLGLTCAVACSGKGEPTTPEKAADYTANNIKQGVEGAPGVARRSGKRISKAVDDPEQAVMGPNAQDAESESDASEEGASGATDGAEGEEESGTTE